PQAEGERRVRLLRNDLLSTGPLPNSLTVRPRMATPNSHALGAVVRAWVGDLTQSRLITAGTSFLGQEPAEAHFGLGPATQVDELRVEWPDGRVSRLFDLPVNQVLTIFDTQGFSIFGTGFEPPQAGSDAP
ncbi:MAG: ASPIC/UnbV domain-containing protein, partial [Longimicrobiales bacterium]|nr:ASPIC/UnbV domain-containing protein [Longimicrobiales bacterium]